MSLVNQVLKDLEQRHAAEMQAQELGLDDLHYAPISAPPKFRNYRWIISAVVLILLGGATVASVYIFDAWDTQTQDVSVVHIPAQQTAAQMDKVESAPLQASNTQVIETSVQQPAPVEVAATKPETPPAVIKETKAAETRTVAPVPAKTVITNKTVAATTDEEQGNLTKQFVPLSNEQRAEFAYQEGHGFVSKHDYRKAESTLRNALAFMPAHLKARELLSGVYISQGRWIEASELLREGVNLAPQHHTFVKLYARSLMQLKRDVQAIELLQKYQPAPAQDAEHYALLAALHQRQQNHELAARMYSDILKFQPKMGIWWVGMGISLEAMGDRQQATAAYQQARKTGTLNGDVARYTDNRLAALDAIKYPID